MTWKREDELRRDETAAIRGWIIITSIELFQYQCVLSLKLFIVKISELSKVCTKFSRTHFFDRLRVPRKHPVLRFPASLFSHSSLLFMASEVVFNYKWPVHDLLSCLICLGFVKILQTISVTSWPSWRRNIGAMRGIFTIQCGCQSAYDTK